MGTASIANALAFAPNFQKGLQAAAKVMQLLNKVPKIRDASDARKASWVSVFTRKRTKINSNYFVRFRLMVIWNTPAYVFPIRQERAYLC